MKSKIIFFLFLTAFLSGCSNTNPVMMTTENYMKGFSYLKQNNIVKAKTSLREAAKYGHTKSQLLLAIVLINEPVSQENQQANFDEAKQLIQTALLKDEPAATMTMYYLYKKQNDKVNSAIWLAKAQKMNVPSAFYEEATELLKSVNKKDQEKGLNALIKSAKLNYFPAQDRLLLEFINNKNHEQVYIWSSINHKQQITAEDKKRQILQSVAKQSGVMLSEKQKSSADKVIEVILAEMPKTNN